MVGIPRLSLLDGIYGTRINRTYLKDKGIRFGGRPLGRPVKKTEENADQMRLAKKHRKQDTLERIPIEGKFGQEKNGYRLNCVRARTAKTSEVWINAIFLVMNLLVLLRMWCARKMNRLATVVRVLGVLFTGPLEELLPFVIRPGLVIATRSGNF
jgi:transposase, IS5 family